MVKINNIPDADGCIDEEIFQNIRWMKDEQNNALYQEIDGGQRKLVDFPNDFDIARVETIRDGKAFFIEGEQGRKLVLLKGKNQQYYAVGSAAKTDDKGRVVLSHVRNIGRQLSSQTIYSGHHEGMPTR